jgi:hypothetical protein
VTEDIEHIITSLKQALGIQSPSTIFPIVQKTTAKKNTPQKENY